MTAAESLAFASLALLSLWLCGHEVMCLGHCVQHRLTSPHLRHAEHARRRSQMRYLRHHGAWLAVGLSLDHAWEQLWTWMM